VSRDEIVVAAGAFKVHAMPVMAKRYADTIVACLRHVAKLCGEPEPQQATQEPAQPPNPQLPDGYRVVTPEDRVRHPMVPERGALCLYGYPKRWEPSLRPTCEWCDGFAYAVPLGTFPEGDPVPSPMFHGDGKGLLLWQDAWHRQPPPKYGLIRRLDANTDKSGLWVGICTENGGDPKVDDEKPRETPPRVFVGGMDGINKWAAAWSKQPDPQKGWRRDVTVRSDGVGQWVGIVCEGTWVGNEPPDEIADISRAIYELKARVFEIENDMRNVKECSL
jgi:hypothetical protein